jgi:UDP-N-acetylmuramoyl-tripeptide--D-alanyl-D-alanine ligase
MLSRIFPFKLHLHILQLEGYSAKRFLNWLTGNFWIRSIEKKKPLVWTQKARSIGTFAWLYFGAAIVALSVFFGLFGFFLGILTFSQPYTYLLLGLLTLKPYEFLNRQRVKNKIKHKVQNLKKNGLVVIGITGSYGKTTTKDYLYTLLKSKYSVLKTPESYNTLFGIAKVVDLELSEGYDFFICEMGAYCKGEIKELCNILLPDHGILIGINEQHLERFGSIENTIKAKFELIQALPEKGMCLLNITSANVKENYQKYTSNPTLYGEVEAENYFEELTYKDGKSSCDFHVAGQKYHVEGLNIVGEGNISNALAAFVAASSLGIDDATVLKALKKLMPTEHRLEVRERADGVTIIDDAYSSNVAGFKVALDFLDSYKDRFKVLVTPGIVELGSSTKKIHAELGVLADGLCDLVLLVGKSVRTDALAGSIAPSKIVYMDSIKELEAQLGKLINPVVLIENDLPENY